VLDGVERRRFLVEPARKSAVPALVRLLHVELDERAGQLFIFPRRRRLARPKPHDHILPSHRLAGVERDVLNDTVALVEDAEHRHALRHRRHSTLACGSRRRLPRTRQRCVLLLASLTARGERERDQQRCRNLFHAYSGIQGS